MNDIFNSKANKKRRQELRGHMPEPEQRLWHRIRGQQLGVKFRRQHGIGNYIVDFYCPKLALVIELDGDSHYVKNAQHYDQLRDDFMDSLGLKILRFTNQQIMDELDMVLQVIWNAVH
ncbi:endonuclease domain-containing protein [Celerinatantimonas sp. YJH-8]|uniref:endonuclease domain-containing protein n=1 Tax=Celerinatantimonas sp. YJH-8 TaxID=3228714 RepID=UPI0038C1CF14